MNWWLGGWMNVWASYVSMLRYVFTEGHLRWGASSLSYFFSEQPLIWASSPSSCLPTTSSVASATQCKPSLHAASTVLLQRPAAIPQSTRVALWWKTIWKTTFRAAAIIRLATSSCNRAYALLPPAVPTHFVQAGCKPACYQDRRITLTNLRAAETWLDHAQIAPQCFFVLFKPSSRYILVHILPTSSSKSAPPVLIL